MSVLIHGLKLAAHATLGVKSPAPETLVLSSPTLHSGSKSLNLQAKAHRKPSTNKPLGGLDYII